MQMERYGYHYHVEQNMAFIVVGNSYQFIQQQQQKRIMCAKKEITKSNILTFSTWYDIKPVVVMPKMKMKFKKMQICVIKQTKETKQVKWPKQETRSNTLHRSFFLFCLLFPISTSSVKQPQKAVMENKSYYSANIILTPRP